MEIRDLLLEASDVDCSPERRLAIRNHLLKKSHGGRAGDREHIEVGHILKEVFDDAAVNRPDFLPYLFPLFAVACGDRETNYDIAKVDWSLIK